MGNDLPFDLPDEVDDIAEQAELVGKLTPREYAQLRGKAPQLVYYHIRKGTIQVERCQCGRKVIDVQLSDKALSEKARNRRGVLDTRPDDLRTESGQGTPMQGVSEDEEMGGGPQHPL